MRATPNVAALRCWYLLGPPSTSSGLAHLTATTEHTPILRLRSVIRRGCVFSDCISFCVVRNEPTHFVDIQFQTSTPFTALLQGQVLLVNATLTANIWEQLLTSTVYVVVFRGILGGLAVTSDVYAAWSWYRLVAWGKKKRSLLQTQQACYAIELLSNCIRAVFLFCDGVWATDVLTIDEKQVLFSIWQPLCIISGVFLAYTWSDIVDMTGARPAILNHKRALMLLCGFLCVVELFAIASRVTGSASFAVTLSGGLYLVLHLCFAIFFALQGSQCLLRCFTACSTNGPPRRALGFKFRKFMRIVADLSGKGPTALLAAQEIHRKRRRAFICVLAMGVAHLMSFAGWGHMLPRGARCAC